MKIIINKNTSELKKVTDDIADILVRKGGHEYRPRSEWKLLRDANTKIKEEVLPKKEQQPRQRKFKKRKPKEN